MTRTLFIAVLTALSLTACGPDFETDAPDELKGGSTSTGTSGKRSKTTQATTFASRTTDARVAGAEPTWKDQFGIDATYDVFFASEITGSLAGHHVATFEVRMPDGMPYARYDIAFATDVAAGSGEQQAEATATGYRVWANMPVAGTMIEQSNLAGTWTVDVFIDGSATPAASSLFSLY